MKLYLSVKLFCFSGTRLLFYRLQKGLRTSKIALSEPKKTGYFLINKVLAWSNKKPYCSSLMADNMYCRYKQEKT
jgi:hypothetical protein